MRRLMNTWHNNVIYSSSGSQTHTDTEDEEEEGGAGVWVVNTATDALKTTPEWAPDNTDQSERGQLALVFKVIRGKSKKIKIKKTNKKNRKEKHCTFLFPRGKWKEKDEEAAARSFKRYSESIRGRQHSARLHGPKNTNTTSTIDQTMSSFSPSLAPASFFFF